MSRSLLNIEKRSLPRLRKHRLPNGPYDGKAMRSGRSPRILTHGPIGNQKKKCGKQDFPMIREACFDHPNKTAKSAAIPRGLWRDSTGGRSVIRAVFPPPSLVLVFGGQWPSLLFLPQPTGPPLAKGAGTATKGAKGAVKRRNAVRVVLALRNGDRTL
jgi:hypothetical protein